MEPYPLPPRSIGSAQPSEAKMKTPLILAAAAALLSAAGPAPAEGRNHNRDHSNMPCFFVTQWNGWKSPNPDTLYLGVNLHDVYEVKLSTPSDQLSWPDMHLVSITRGPDSVCSPEDLDLKIADINGFATPLIAKSIRKLSPEEVAAIPKKYLPN